MQSALLEGEIQEYNESIRDSKFVHPLIIEIIDEHEIPKRNHVLPSRAPWRGH